MASFTVYPAIDLRQGQVVRLAQGDLERQTVYGTNPAETARRWLDAGARWLHVVNLDGAFDQPDPANRQALLEILQAANEYPTSPQVQFGGGMRSLAAVEQAVSAGVGRVVMGTVVVQAPAILAEVVQRFGSQRVAAGLDASAGTVMLRGWQESSGLSVLQVVQQLARAGVRTVIFTDIQRDGMGAGINLEATAALAQESGLDVIASGGVHSLEDVRKVKQAGLSGVIIGRALYTGSLKLTAALELEEV